MSDNKVINTRRLQIFTLMFFMQAEHQCVFDGSTFTSGYDDGVAYSFDQAVKMYNDFEDKDMQGYFFETMKLQLSKKDKKIICQSNMLKFTEEFKGQCQELGVEPEHAMMEILRSRQLR